MPFHSNNSSSFGTLYPKFSLSRGRLLRSIVKSRFAPNRKCPVFANAAAKTPDQEQAFFTPESGSRKKSRFAMLRNIPCGRPPTDSGNDSFIARPPHRIRRLRGENSGIKGGQNALNFLKCIPNNHISADKPKLNILLLQGKELYIPKRLPGRSSAKEIPEENPLQKRTRRRRPDADRQYDTGSFLHDTKGADFLTTRIRNRHLRIQ